MGRLGTTAMAAAGAIVVMLALLASGAQAASFEEVAAIIDGFEGISSLYFVVGDRNGIAWTHQKGDTGYETQMEIMSASKWVSATTIMSLVQAGLLSLDDHPQKYLEFWTSDPADLRSHITLQNLLSFTSGFSDQLDDPACIATNMELYDCAKLCFEEGKFLFTPGETFQYGSIHLQIAGAMAEKASGKPFRKLFKEIILDPLQLNNTYYNTSAGNNPALAFGLISSTREYRRFLEAYYLDHLLSTDVRKVMELDYTPNRDGVALKGYHYSLGNWFECRMLTWIPRCLEENIHGSVGAFGFYPLVDRRLDYYFVIGTDSGWPGGTTLASLLRHEIKPLLDELMVARKL